MQISVAPYACASSARRTISSTGRKYPSSLRRVREKVPGIIAALKFRNAPGLNNNVPGYMWGAGHAMELAYMWPSFNNGFSLFDELTPAQLQLSHQMVRWWGAFARFGAPLVHGQPLWPSYQRDEIMSLRPGDASQTIPNSEFGAEHNCAFWNSIPGAIGG